MSSKLENIDNEALKKVLDQIGVDLSKIDLKDFIVPGEKRVETRRAWMMDGREATDAEVDLFQEMPFILGSSVTPAEPREITQDEIDGIAYELTSVNKTKDILEGRVSKIRETVFNAFNFLAEQDGLDDAQFTPNTFVSEKYGVKLCREITGGKPFVDMDLAREVLGDTFEKIVNRIESIKVTYTPDGNAASEETTVEYEINEKALETQMALGNITVEDLTKITATTKKIAKFIPRKL